MINPTLHFGLRQSLGRRWLLLGLMLCAQQAHAFEGDYVWDERFQAARVKARSGLARDQYAVGEMYFHGRGTKTDQAEAQYWFLLAARQGHTKAAYKAGLLYLHGEGVEANPGQAQHWLEKSARAGYAPAQYELGQFYATNEWGHFDAAQALKWLGKAKAAGFARADAAFSNTVNYLIRSRKRGPPQEELEKSSAGTGHKPGQHAVVDRLDPRRIILRSQWDGKDGPSTLLPSVLTECRERGNGIECLSFELSMQLASTHVVYRTRTEITDIKADGQFRMAYANQVLSADTEGSDEGGEKEPTVKIGWQRNERMLDCSLMSGRTISCAHGTMRQYRFVGH